MSRRNILNSFSPGDSIIIPDRDRIIFLFKWISLILISFVLVYVGSNWINSKRTLHYHLFFQWETRLPFVPFFIIIYLSTFFSFIFPALLMDRNEIDILGFRYLFVIIFSGIIFLIFPTEFGFPRSENFERLKQIYTLLYFVDRPYNLFPSLHISYSAITVFSLLNKKCPALNYPLIIWLILVSISVVAVHQHHIIDIFGGYVTALLSMKLIHPVSRKNKGLQK